MLFYFMIALGGPVFRYVSLWNTPPHRLLDPLGNADGKMSRDIDETIKPPSQGARRREHAAAQFFRFTPKPRSKRWTTWLWVKAWSAGRLTFLVDHSVHFLWENPESPGFDP